MAEDQEFAPESDPQVHACDREDTMLYREPTEDTDAASVQEIWGTKLETRIVDAKSDEYQQLLDAGWVADVLKLSGLGHAPPGFEPVKKDVPADPPSHALEAAEKLAHELGETVKSLTKERDDALQAAKDATDKIAALENDLSAEKALRQSSIEHIRRLEEEAKAAKGAKPKP